MKIPNTIVLLSLVCITVASTNKSECGNPGTLDDKNDFVVDQDVSPGEWPWHVMIFKTNKLGLFFLCSGSLVETNVVITGAECVVQNVHQPQKFVVYLNKLDPTTWGRNDRSVAKSVQRIEISPLYLETASADGDIAIMFLHHNSDLPRSVTPVCIFNNTEMQIQAEGTVSGWGRTNSESDHLEHLNFNVVKESRDICVSENPQLEHILTDNKFCAAVNQGFRFCSGYSGSGLYENVKSSDGMDSWTLRGVSSRSNLTGQFQDSCLNNTYFVFTDVVKFLPWIKHHLSNNMDQVSQEKEEKSEESEESEEIDESESESNETCTGNLATQEGFLNEYNTKMSSLSNYQKLTPCITYIEDLHLNTLKNSQAWLTTVDLVMRVFTNIKKTRGQVSELVLSTLSGKSKNKIQQVFKALQNKGRKALTDKSVSSIEIAKFMINSGADLNYRTERGKSILLWAAQHGNLDIVKWLITDQHIDVNDKDMLNNTALHLAVRNEHLDVVTWLVKTGHANLNEKDGWNNTAVQLAASYGLLEVVKVLVIDGHADVNIKDHHNSTALHKAAERRNLDVVKVLVIEGHADVNIIDTYGETALTWATKRGRYHIVQWLVEVGGAVQIQQ